MAAADWRIVRWISILLVVVTLAAAGSAHAAGPTDLSLAAHNVLDARPAAEVYWVTHRKSYSGMTTARLAAIGGAYGGPIRARVVWATRSNYCLQSSVRGASAHAFSSSVSRLVWLGPCPPRP